jgi:hypothetical protein
MPMVSRRQVIPLMLAAAALPRAALAERARYRAQDCARAIQRGMHYLHRISITPQSFKEFGNDTIWTFLDLARTVDPLVNKRARAIGQELARRWLKENPSVPKDADAGTLNRLCAGSFSAHQIGVPSPRLKAELERAVKRFGPVDFMKFDPRKEGVPDDLSEVCDNCDTQNDRGVLVCRTCSAPVKLSNPYDTFTAGLVSTYTWERYGLSFGSTLADVTRHLPSMRPYRGYENGRNAGYAPICYAVTHVVYVLNDYFLFRLKPEWLPEEFEFLRSNLMANLATNDSDLMGEFLDSLKSFGVTDDDPLIRTGIDFLLSRQNPDGSWGMADQSGVYTPYHATSTACNGLSYFAFTDEKVTSEEALRRAYGK